MAREIQPQESRVSRSSASRTGGFPGLLALVSLAVVVPLVAGAGGVVRAGMAPGEVEIDLPVYAPSYVAGGIAEKWHYSFAWSGFPVGELSMAAQTEAARAGRVLRVEVAGRTNALVDLLWRYRLQARGTILIDPFAPAEYSAEESERGKRKLTTIRFGQDRRVMTARLKGEKLTEHEFFAPNTHDFLSTIFLFLNLDYEVGQEYRVDTLTGTARYLVTLQVQARDSVRAAGREWSGYRLWVTTRELTDPDEDEANHRGTLFWVSDDRPHKLLRARARTFVGAISLELRDIEILGGAVAEDPG